MKQKIKTVLGIVLLWMPLFSANAQQVNGVYLTEQDYHHHMLSDSVTTDDQNYIEEVLGRQLTVYRNGEKKRYAFGTVYGYYQNGIKYRAYGRRILFHDYGFYRVVEDSAVTIYSKKARHHRSTGYTWYYYSTTPAAPLKRLTRKNLEKDFDEGVVDQLLGKWIEPQ